MKAQRSPLKRGIQILNFLRDADGGQSLEQIAAVLDVNKSTAFRLLEALEEYHFVARPNRSSGYFLGHACIGLAEGFRRNFPLVEVARPILSRLRDQTGESVGLYVVRIPNRICIVSADSRQPVRRTLEIGQVVPLDRGAVSKVILANLPNSIVDDILAELPDRLVRWQGSITKSEFIAEIEEARKLGYATSIEETDHDIWAVGVPVLSRDGELLAALIVSGPKSRYSKAALRSMIAESRQAADDISNSI